MFNSIGGDAVGAFSGDNEANRALLLLDSCLTLVFYPHMLRHLAASETNLVRFTPAFACALHAILWQVATMQKLCREDVKHFWTNNHGLDGGLKCFLFSPPTWGRFPFWLILFKWVETTKMDDFIDKVEAPAQLLILDQYWSCFTVFKGP